MSDAPAVTVVTPVHDAAGTLAEAVASVQAQTMGSWEMILVDDPSEAPGRGVRYGGRTGPDGGFEVRTPYGGRA